MIKTAFICNSPDTIDRVYGNGRKEQVGAISDLYPTVITAENFHDHVEALRDLEAAFSTWGMLNPTEEQLDLLPSLKAVFYAAGSVKGFAEPFLKRGITVVSGWGANGVPVAEFALAQILLSNKGYFPNMRACVSRETRGEAFRGPGNFGETDAILGAGMIGKALIKLLKPFNLKVIVWDWGWGGCNAPDKIIPLLPKSVYLMCMSERGLSITRGGITSVVREYSLWAVGPSPRALHCWELARKCGVKTAAKVQVNTTWELASLPYLPVMDLVAEHCQNLVKAKVRPALRGRQRVGRALRGRRSGRTRAGRIPETGRPGRLCAPRRGGAAAAPGDTSAPGRRLAAWLA